MIFLLVLILAVLIWIALLLSLTGRVLMVGFGTLAGLIVQATQEHVDET